MHLKSVYIIIGIVLINLDGAKPRLHTETMGLGGGGAAERSVSGMSNLHETQYFGRVEKEPENEAKRILMAVSSALKEKGYNPVNQIVGYILSGDPTYITSHQNARVLIRKLERDELLEELVKEYLNRNA